MTDLELVQSAVARCSVCQLEGTLLTVHSESSHDPECPAGWGDLWTGFTYTLGVVSVGGVVVWLGVWLTSRNNNIISV